jgi:mono/diheme cytochrome c family protein
MKNVLLIVFAAALVTSISAFQDKPKFDLKASMEKGKDTYTIYCMSCHMEAGEGMEGVFPPLAKSDYLMADKNRMIKQILYGANGPMKVNGKTYNAEMTGFDLSDQEVADLSNYIRNSFGNKGAAVMPAEVKAARNK